MMIMLMMMIICMTIIILRQIIWAIFNKHLSESRRCMLHIYHANKFDIGEDAEKEDLAISSTLQSLVALHQKIRPFFFAKNIWGLEVRQPSESRRYMFYNANKFGIWQKKQKRRIWPLVARSKASSSSSSSSSSSEKEDLAISSTLQSWARKVTRHQD